MKNVTRITATLPDDVKKELEKLAEKDMRPLSTELAYVAQEYMKLLANPNFNPADFSSSTSSQPQSSYSNDDYDGYQRRRSIIG